MKQIDETITAFEKYLDTVSDSKLDKMLEQIDLMGINGPTVDEYFSSLTENISSFFNEVSETSTIADVESLFCDTRISRSHKFNVPPVGISGFCSPELASQDSSFYSSGETPYLMAA